MEEILKHNLARKRAIIYAPFRAITLLFSSGHTVHVLAVHILYMCFQYPCCTCAYSTHTVHVLTVPILYMCLQYPYCRCAYSTHTVYVLTLYMCLQYPYCTCLLNDVSPMRAGQQSGTFLTTVGVIPKQDSVQILM